MLEGEACPCLVELKKLRRRLYVCHYQKERRQHYNENQHKLRLKNPSKYRKYWREYYHKNKDMILKREHDRREIAKSRERTLERGYCLKARTNTKINILTHYGNGKLACLGCGETRLDCLSLDHINNDGMAHRKQLGFGGYKFYRLLIKEDYPSGYQTLCMNCQWVKKAENQRAKRLPIC